MTRLPLGVVSGIVGPCLCAGTLLVAPPATEAAVAGPLPPDVAQLIRDEFGTPDSPLRTLSGEVDLNADGHPELIVYVVGPMACGTGGCPTLVLTPAKSGYRLVTSISVSREPIRVSTARTAGWRNLIVHIAGGGAKAADMELLFDGRSYPTNPTVAGPRVRVANTAGSQIVIAEMHSFEDAVPLPGTASRMAYDAGPGPSFDCDKATTDTERLICGDAELAGLDGALAAAYAAGMKQWPAEEQTRERKEQRAWIAERDACSKRQDARACLKSSYRRRLIELQIRGGALEAPTPVGYVCQGHENEPFQVAFYNQTDPRSAVVTFGDRQDILFGVTSASGAHYRNPRVDFWEHHGEATVTWSGESFVCKSR